MQTPPGDVMLDPRPGGKGSRHDPVVLVLRGPRLLEPLLPRGPQVVGLGFDTAGLGRAREQHELRSLVNGSAPVSFSCGQ
jgi:hypothetical protein